ncbi:hypothetical protein [Pinibacter aurantiacus]|uniref:Uncharacterized protein n=1 Tax=Pinibacter aurantiacus TaxID=2851599 RepID=A0A9E2SEG7_9BACT|nr:hypothetical protein [Pinibacter aurantiacus]MBV4358555.1 hypothetical protein [Pinibacter aurantiacus]
MITKKLPLDTADRRILSKNMTIAFLVTLLVTLAFLSMIVFFFIQNNHWSIGEVLICMIASILPLAMINAYVDYHRNMMNSNKYVYAGIITDKFSRKNKFLNNSYFTLDGQKVFFGGAISAKHSDQIQMWDWIEVHWLPHTKKALYIKKIKPFRQHNNVIFAA